MVSIATRTVAHERNKRTLTLMAELFMQLESDKDFEGSTSEAKTRLMSAIDDCFDEAFPVDGLISRQTRDAIAELLRGVDQ